MAELEQIRESQSVMSPRFQVILKKNSISHDISERLKKEPNVVDSSDYKENLTYVNEIALNLNNDDGVIHNIAGTGLLDVAQDTVIECEVFCTIGVGARSDLRAKVFGGWVDTKKIKPDAVNEAVTVVVYSYFGKAERLSGLNIVTRYFDSNGLILYNTGLFVTRANIPGKILTNGLHTIEIKQEEGQLIGLARLDDGEWIPVDYPDYTILSNRDNTEQIEIGAALTEHGAEGESPIIVKNQGEQYPYTFYYFGSATDIIKQCFELIGCTSYEVDEFEISSFDGRRLLSWMPNFPGQNYFGFPNCIVSNGTDRIYLSITTTNQSGADLDYEIWEINLTTKLFGKRYSTTLPWYDKDKRHQLELSADGSRLFAYFKNPLDDAFVQKFDTNNWDRFSYTIDDDTYEWGQTHLIRRGNGGRIIFCGEHIPTGNKHVYIMTLGDTDDPGEIISVYQDNTIDPSSFQHVYDDGEDIWFYFVEKTGPTTWWLRRLKFDPDTNTWDYEEVAQFPIDTHPGNVRGYDYQSKDKIALFSYGDDKAHFIRHTAKTISGNLCPEGWSLYSGWEEPEGSNKKLYCIAQLSDVPSDEKLSYFDDETFVFSETSPEGINLILGADPVRKQDKFCTAVDGSGEKIIVLTSEYPGMLIRYSNTFIPTIFGEYNTDGKSVRDILQEIANNYLAFIRIDENKKGYFVKREDFSSDKSMAIKKDYVKGNVRETLYNEKYNYVRVTTRNNYAEYGSKHIDNKALEVSLDLIPDEYAKDFARYFHAYYSIARNLYSFKYLPTYFDMRALDKVNLTNIGIASEGRIQYISPREEELELRVICDISNSNIDPEE